MQPNDVAIIALIRDPHAAKSLSLRQWELVIRQARYSILLAHLYFLLKRCGLVEDIPSKPREHLEAASMVSAKQAMAVQWEVNCVNEAFAPFEIDTVILKGGAYVVEDLPNAAGRMLSDIDLLVPRHKLDSAERSLMMKGWVGDQKDSYDKRYYREWMHEIPPMTHNQRGSTLDVHHTILPPTARYKPDPDKLLSNIRPTKLKNTYVLAPEDMLIHSATHLFHEGEFEHGLRDLVDIHELLNHFGENEPGFWERLVPRAIELDLIRPLYYGLHYVQLILGVSVPDEVMAEANAGRPSRLMSKVMDFLFMRALMPDHPSCDQPFTGLARWLLYVRSHYLRMPMHLLIPHLVRKSWKRRFDKPEALVPDAGAGQ